MVKPDPAEDRPPGRLAAWLDSFPLGRTPLVMLALFVVSALLVGFSGHLEGRRLVYWCFARTHYDDYMSAKERFEAAHPGWRVDIKLVDHASLLNRLTAAFVRGSGAPDATEIEITGIGRFFKGEAAEVSFEDLEALGAQQGDAGWPSRIVEARFAPWSYQGHIFGMPQDLHPVVLLYRQDLFSQLGYPDLPAAAQTWGDFLKVALQVSRPREVDPGHPHYAIGLHNSDFWEFWQMLYQRGGGIYDAQRRPAVDSPEAVEVLDFYAALFHTHRVAWPIRDLPSFWGAIKRDEVLCFLAADWFVGFLRNNVPEQAGLWRAMPMPAWYPGGRRVSSFGGTTTVIPRQGENREMAWEFTKLLYLDREETVSRALKTRVMPAMHESYEDPRLLGDRFAYLGGQELGRLFAELRNQIPPVYLHSSWTEASTQLGTVILRAIQQEDTPANLLYQYRQYIEGIMQRYASVEALLRGGR
ncbi:MAG: extracellular solute-binding protein [Candidatus Latescibacteria bacterium]|nr:extracellular solute-binding protein [Candidatus Latescibacterota bacterium]